jgi:hypothetical protein
MLEDKLEQDIKTALLSGDSKKATTLRGLKAALLNIKVASGKRESGLSDEEVMDCLAKEAKKRQESIDLYKQGGNEDKANQELEEKKLIEAYLPPKLNQDELVALVDDAIKSTNADGIKDMGKVIGIVKSKAGAGADGGLIASIVKEKLQ